jgi:hypothetical protein
MLRYALILHPAAAGAAAVGAWWPGRVLQQLFRLIRELLLPQCVRVLSLFQRIIPTDRANCFGTGALPTLRA